MFYCIFLKKILTEILLHELNITTVESKPSKPAVIFISKPSLYAH